MAEGVFRLNKKSYHSPRSAVGYSGAGVLADDGFNHQSQWRGRVGMAPTCPPVRPSLALGHPRFLCYFGQVYNNRDRNAS